MDRQHLILEGEAPDDLNVNGLFVLQHEGKYHFTSDAVALTDFVKVPARGAIADFGAGCGIISILLAGKKGAERVNAIEIQEYMADLSRRNARYNSLESRIKVFCADIRDAAKILGHGSQAAVVCNPPYRKKGSGDKSRTSEVALSRHEESMTLDALAKAAGEVLKFSGKLYLIHQAERAAEVVYTLKKYNLETKIIKPLLPKAGAKPHLVLVCAVLGGRAGTDFLRAEIIGEIGL